jgi:hypothetical protein
MINRLCGSGFQSVVNAAQEIKLGKSFNSSAEEKLCGSMFSAIKKMIPENDS